MYDLASTSDKTLLNNILAGEREVLRVSFGQFIIQ
jgi:hypothetical protein